MYPIVYLGLTLLIPYIGYLGKSGAHLLLRDEVDVMIEGKTEVFVYRSK